MAGKAWALSQTVASATDEGWRHEALESEVRDRLGMTRRSPLRFDLVFDLRRPFQLRGLIDVQTYRTHPGS